MFHAYQSASALYSVARRRLRVTLVVALLMSPAIGAAADIGDVRGVVHDARHRPIAAAGVQLKAAASAWSRSAPTDANGEFAFPGVPLGDYVLTVSQSGFVTTSQPFTVVAGAAPSTHIQLAAGDSLQTVVVTASALPNAETFTTSSLVNRQDIQITPGADRSNSLAMITDYVPGAYFGPRSTACARRSPGHLEVDGVEIPNTNIASNLGAPDRSQGYRLTWRWIAVATVQRKAIEPMASSMSYRAPALSATMKPTLQSAAALSARPMTMPASAAIPTRCDLRQRERQSQQSRSDDARRADPP